MNDFSTFCFLVVQRQKANYKRKRLLYALNVRRKEIGDNWPHRNIKHFGVLPELTEYREHCEAMKHAAKHFYSPLRRELKIKVKYDSNNHCESLEFDGVKYPFNKVREMSDSHIFETVVLDKKGITNPYKSLS